jgi:alpha/beta hydrolase family protein
MKTVALVHSPLVGPLTWSLVAPALRRRGIEALTPAISQDDRSREPLSKQHARSVGDELRNVPADRAIVLVGHSGAGQLLPLIRQAAGRPVSAYLFVDAGIPHDGEARIEPGESGDHLRAMYLRGERFPNWTDDQLQEVLPDPLLRRQLLNEVRAQPWSFWTEPIEVFPGWPDAPCGYLRFTPNPTYDDAAAEARRLGWPHAELVGGHFHMLVEPEAVTEALLQLLEKTARDGRLEARRGNR